MNAYLVAATAIAAMLSLVYLLSLAKKDASIIDIVWGLGFVLVGWVSWWVAGQPQQLPALLLPALTSVWGLRLSLYLLWRNWSKEEDRRYQAMRANWRPFWLHSIWLVFGLQGVLMWVIALPQMTAKLGQAPELGLLDAIGGLIVLGGVAWEATADIQLARFKADPANKGRVLDTGLWALSRHPNYFGDFVVWWGLFLVGLGRGAPWWTVVSPLIMSWLLMKVSGVPLLESDIQERRPKYAEYIARTSAFFPWPPAATKRA